MPYPSKTDSNAILAAAIKQLDQQGLRGLSLRALAASLELAPNALYRYFADRSVLEAALAGEVYRLLQAAMQRAVRESIEEEAIRAISHAYLAFARKRPHLYELLLIPSATKGEERVHHETLRRFVADHVMTIAGPQYVHEASVALWAFLHGIAQLEAANVFGKEKPGASFEFGLNAWLAAAVACHPKKHRVALNGGARS